MAEDLPKVEVGQIWEDLDKRQKGRRVKVLRLYEGYKPFRNDPVPMAECEVVKDKDRPADWTAKLATRRKSTKPRIVHIAVERMKPCSTGYRLVHAA